MDFRASPAPLAVATCCLFLFASLEACKAKPPPEPEPWVSRSPPAPPPAPPTTSKVELTSAELGGDRVTLSVPGDRDILVVTSEASADRPIVHLHGMCASPHDDIKAFGGELSALGTVIALSGDVPCADGSGHMTWSRDARALHERIVAAMTAVRANGVELDRAKLVLLGESMGASRAESLAELEPTLYHRLVLIGPPQAASANRLAHVSAVATLAGEKEPQESARKGKRTLESIGRKAHFWELPGANHGDYGPEGGKVMRDAVRFVIDAR